MFTFIAILACAAILAAVPSHRIIGRDGGRSTVLLEDNRQFRLDDGQLATFQETGELPEVPTASTNSSIPLEDRVAAIENRFAKADAMIEATAGEMQEGSFDGLAKVADVETVSKSVEELQERVKKLEELIVVRDEEKTLPDKPHDPKKGK